MVDVAQNPLLTAVLEPRRRAILRVLEQENGLPVGQLARHFDVSRPAISQHLAVLRAAGLVEMRPEKGRTTYCVVDARVAAARRAIAELVCDLPGPAIDVPVPQRAETASPGSEEPPPESAGPPPDPALERHVAAPPGPAGPPPDLALEQHAAAPPERVFAAAATRAGQALWLGAAEGDAEEGGRFRVDLGGDTAAGTYFAVEAPEHLAFGWGQEGGGRLAPDASRVDLHFTPTPTGTLIRLEHRGLPTAAHAPHLGSWAHHLPRLAAAAAEAARS
jgi:uncharacterized protein YndB with AHSA1/START domain/DNA-binding transcriptional ArsR family regulator